MIKTKCFISVFLLLIAFNMNVAINYAQDSLGEISLPPSEKPQLNVSDKPSVYFPSKLIIGQENIFTVKGKPGCKVSLAVSDSNRGAKPLMGKTLRLGETEQTLEAVIPATGAVEVKYTLPEDPALVNRVKYIEVAIWSNEDFSDMEIATTISPTGRETRNNGISITLPPESGKRPSFAPIMPGVGYELIRSIEHVKQAQDGKINPELLDDDGTIPAYLDSPEKRDLMLQNLDD